MAIAYYFFVWRDALAFKLFLQVCFACKEAAVCAHACLPVIHAAQSLAPLLACMPSIGVLASTTTNDRSSILAFMISASTLMSLRGFDLNCASVMWGMLPCASIIIR